MQMISIFCGIALFEKKFINLVNDVGFLYQFVIILFSSLVKAMPRKDIVFLISVSIVNCGLGCYELNVSSILSKNRAIIMSSTYLSYTARIGYTFF